MIQEPTVVHSQPAGDSTAHVVHALMHFLMAARYRKNLVFLSLAVAAILGGVYFATATPFYPAYATVLVLRSNSESINADFTSDGAGHKNLMPTFVKLFKSTKVVRGALPYLRPEDRIDLVGSAQEAWPAIIQGNLTAESVLRTNLIEVSYRSKDPRTAVAVLKAVVASYRGFLDETHKSTSAAVMEVLNGKLGELAEEIVQKAAEEARIRDEVGDITSHSDSNATHPTLKSALHFGEKLDEIQTQRIQLEVSQAALQASILNGEDLQQHVMKVASVVGEELFANALGINRNDAFLQGDAWRNLLNDQAALNTMLKDLGPLHPDVTNLQDRIRMWQEFLASYSDQMSAKVARIQDTVLGPKLEEIVQQKLAEVWQSEIHMQAKFDQAQAEAFRLNGDLARLQIIKQQLERLRESEDKLLSQMAGIDLKYDGQEVRTEVVQSPVEAGSPISPSLRRVIMMALLGGLGMGMGLVYVLDILDDRFRSIEEMQAQLNVPVLAMVRQLGTGETGTGETGEAGETGGAESLKMYTDPNSAECEAFRTLRTGLALADRQARQIVISSAEPSDGKTTVLANLAVSYAQSDKRTLLIDADLRRPGMTALMGMRGIDGLSGAIRGTGSVVEAAKAAIRPSGVPALDVLPSGPRPANPAELLANPRFSELLAWAETVYDQVLVDSPPALATSDAAVIGRLMDGVVMVVQPDKNRRRMVIRAVESFAALKISLLGIVVNRVGSENDRGYYGYGDGYGYGYSYEYGNEPEDAEGAAASGQNVPEVGLPRRLAAEERDDSAVGIVPRRIG